MQCLDCVNSLELSKACTKEAILHFGRCFDQVKLSRVLKEMPHKEVADKLKEAAMKVSREWNMGTLTSVHEAIVTLREVLSNPGHWTSCCGEYAGLKEAIGNPPSSCGLLFGPNHIPDRTVIDSRCPWPRR